MKYKIVVDKQGRLNPSEEKREYEIDIEELHVRGNIYDSLIITKDEDYVIRRLQKNEYNALNVLDEPVIESLDDINIELFEGDNYIYLKDMTGNKIYAEYLLKNEFTDRYVTKNEMNAEINAKANQIELNVTQKLEEYTPNLDEYSTTQEIQSMIQIEANSIKSSVSSEYATKTALNTTKSNIEASLELKVDTDDLISEINASADRISLTSGRLVITSGNFKLNSSGNITCTGGTIGGFTLGSKKFSCNLSGAYQYSVFDQMIGLGFAMSCFSPSSLYSLWNVNNDNAIDVFDVLAMQQGTTKNITGTFSINTDNPKDCIVVNNGSNTAVSIGVGGINSYMIVARNIVCCNSVGDSFSGVVINGSTGYVYAKSFSNTSLAELKKNIEELGNTIDIIENSKIYTFNYKTEENEQKKHIGFVIGEEYNTPKEVIDENERGIDLYAMNSIEWKGLQECIKLIKDLQNRVEILEGGM